MKKVLLKFIIIVIGVTLPNVISSASLTKKELIENVYISFIMSSTYIRDRKKAEYIYRITHKESKKNGFQTSMVLSQQFRESSFNPKAVSSYKARGLGQVVHRKWTWYPKYNEIIDKESDLHDIRKGVQAQVLILKKMYKWEKDMGKALNRYSGFAKDYDKKIFTHMNEINNKIKLIKRM